MVQQGWPSWEEVIAREAQLRRGAWSRTRRGQVPDESEEFNRGAVDAALDGRAEEPCDPRKDPLFAGKPAPPAEAPPYHLLSQYPEEPMVEIPEALPNNEGNFGGIPLDLMSEHTSAADQAAF